MTRIGFHASHEQFAPSRLLACLKRAEAAGFQAAMCSDHYHPWSERQEHSGYAWSWLGAAFEATQLTLGTVCAPGQRYHPAIIAQAAATLAEMYPGRLWVALGSGENLNEHITGDPWPPKDVREARLLECVTLMRSLLAGETVSHSGHIRVSAARLYTRPQAPPPLIGAAITEDTARWLGTWADGMITVGHKPAAVRKLIEAFRAHGGQGKPVYLQYALSYAPTDDEAVFEAHHQWRHCVLDGEKFADLATPVEFDAACQHASPEEVREKLAVSSDPNWFVARLRDLASLDLDTIYLSHVGRNLERFIDTFGDAVLPKLQ